MLMAHQLIIELQNAGEEEALAFAEDLRQQPGISVKELSSRDTALWIDFLINVAAGSAITLASIVVAHCKSHALSVRIKRGKDRELVITSSEELDPDHLTAVIKDFVDG